MTTTAAIATKLNVLESAIVRCEEWFSVMFVVVKGLGARFVSKKVVEKMSAKTQLINYFQSQGTAPALSEKAATFVLNLASEGCTFIEACKLMASRISSRHYAAIEPIYSQAILDIFPEVSEDESFDEVLQMEIDLSHHNGSVPEYKLHQLAIDVVSGQITYAQAVERITNKKVITKK